MATPATPNPAAPGPATDEKPKVKKPNGCLVAIIVVVLLFIIWPTSKDTDKEPEPTATPVATEAPTPEPTEEPTPAPTEEPAEEAPESAEPVSMADIKPLLEVALKNSFDNYTIDLETIESEDDAINISIWNDGLAGGAVLAAAGNTEAIDGWNNTRQNIIDMCDSSIQLAEAAGKDDAIIIFNVLNDNDTSKVLLSVVNGAVLYDCVNQ